MARRHDRAAADAVVKEVAPRLISHTRDEDTACRNEGDELLFLPMRPQRRENIDRSAEAIVTSTAAPVSMGNLDVIIHANVYIAVYPENGANASELINNAHAAMYKAMADKSGYAFYSTLK